MQYVVVGMVLDALTSTMTLARTESDICSSKSHSTKSQTYLLINSLVRQW